MNMLMFGLGFIGRKLIEKGYLFAEDIVLIDIEEPSDELKFKAFYSCDFREQNQMIMTLQKICIEQKFEVILYIAGVMFPGNIHKLSIEQWEMSMNINVNAPFLVIHETIDKYLETGKGQYIFVSSVFSEKQGVELASYNTSKAALNALVKSVSIDYINSRIRCNMISPSFVKSPMVDKAVKKLSINRYWMNMFNYFKNPYVSIDSIGKAINFIIDNENCNGLDLLVDNGFVNM